MRADWTEPGSCVFRISGTEIQGTLLLRGFVQIFPNSRGLNFLFLSGARLNLFRGHGLLLEKGFVMPD